MPAVLYQKYRSLTFDELVGQSHITNILKNAIKSGSTSHAYLFVGSRGTGKTSTARILAKALNCKNITKDGNPCNDCSVCTAINSGSFLDLVEIDAASNRGIDQMRELKERIEFSPVEGDYKVYIIDEVHMLTTEAFNALLKTLEEPPSHVVFILATTDVHKLPATILSRCQRYDFRLGTNEQVKEVLSYAAKEEGVKLDDKAMAMLVENAHGSYRDGLSLLDVVVSGQLKGEDPKEVTEEEVREILGIPDSTMVYYLLEKLVYRESSDAMDLIQELDSRGVNFQQFVKYVLTALRELLVGKIHDNINLEEFSFAEKLSQKDILKLINLFIEAERKLRNVSIPSLVLEMVVADVAVMDLDILPGAEAGKDGVDSGGTTASGSQESRGTSAKEKPKTSKDKVSQSAKSKSGSNVETKSEESKYEEVRMDDVNEVPVTEAESKSTEKGSSSDLQLEQITGDWDKLTQAVQKHNGHLYAFLKAATVSNLDATGLTLDVPFQFHKDRIEAPKSKEAINAAFNEVFGTTVPVRCNINEAVKRKKSVSADVILKNIPKPAESKSSAGSNSSGGGGSQGQASNRRGSRKLDEIFADM